MNKISLKTKKTEVNLIIFHNNEIYTTPFDKIYSISSIIKKIFNHFSLDPSFYEVVYNGQPLKQDDLRTLRIFLGKNNDNPIFTVRKKKILSSVGNAIIKGNISTISSLPTSSVIVNIINIINMQVIKDQVNEFYLEKKIKSKQKIYFGKRNTATVHLPSSNLALEFIKKINHLKQYPLYKNLQAEIVNEDVKSDTTSNTNKSKRTNISNKNSNSVQKNVMNINNHNNNKHSLFYENYGGVLNNKNQKKLVEFYKHQEYIRNSSPYGFEEAKRKQQEKEDKNNWYDHKGFISSVGKNSIRANYIANYVTLAQSESPLNHKFREIQRQRWLTEKGFC